jgi:sulfite reductase alpha subunit-like flavoprotein
MDDYVPKLSTLPSEPRVVFVASTTGDGDPPDNMRRFWSVLTRADLPEDSLKGVSVAVLGLGDSR